MTKAIVTGASRGIGLAIALKLNALGYTVIGTYKNKPTTVPFELVQLDVCDEKACLALAKKVGTVAVLVNNAGIVKDGLLIAMKQADFKLVLETNLVGAFNMIKAFSPGMLRARSGAIINISSVVGEMGNAGQSNYAASKAGLIGMSKSLAREFGSRGIRVNCIAPGFIETEMTQSLPKDKLLESIPLNRLGTVDDVADAVGYLASAPYVTGQVLSVCGGLNM